VTVEAARAFIVATADFGDGVLKLYARKVLELWGPEERAPAPRRETALTNAEKCRNRRANRAAEREALAGSATPRPTPSDTVATPGATPRDTEVVSAGVAPSRSRDLGLEVSLSSDSSSLPDCLSQQPQDLPLRDTDTDTAGTDTKATPGDTTTALLTLAPSDGKRPRRATRAPSSTDPGATDFCRMHGIPPPIEGSEAARFLDYWASRPGKQGLSLDWAASWRSRPDWTRPASATRLRSTLKQGYDQEGPMRWEQETRTKKAAT
jgi:hypothetical protein